MTSEHTHEWSSPEVARPGTWIEEVVGQDPVVGRWLPTLRRLAAGEHGVLIEGEPGSGRERAARAIHNLSARAAHPFVVVDCASLSEPFIEAELLGTAPDPSHRLPGKIGAIAQAGEGTILLAEVGDLPARGQELLLRALAGPARPIATTSAALNVRAAAGLFREDLLVQLAGARFTLPPLRERADDLLPLARHILARWTGQRPGPAGFTPTAEALLRHYAWPGNLRELREVIEQAALRARGATIDVGHLPERLHSLPGPLSPLRTVEMQHIERVLVDAHGNQRRAARTLGISRWSLSRRLRKYGIEPH